jgi:hypothetical protein
VDKCINPFVVWKKEVELPNHGFGFDQDGRREISSGKIKNPEYK